MQTLLDALAGKPAGRHRARLLGCLVTALAVTFLLLGGAASAALPPDGFSATAGAQFSGTVGGFDVDGDANTHNACIYPIVTSVTIAWGDGSASAATVSEVHGGPSVGAGGIVFCSPNQ